jgi:hypothetical protein
MKKLFTLALSAFILLGANTFAQKVDSLKKSTKTKTKTTVTKASKKADDATATATKKADDTKTVATTTATKKADDAKAAATSTATKKTTETKTATTKAVTEGVNKSADKAVGKDAKGRTIYMGPKGGQYTLSESGKKNYIKTADKLKVN